MSSRQLMGLSQSSDVEKSSGTSVPCHFLKDEEKVSFNERKCSLTIDSKRKTTEQETMILEDVFKSLWTLMAPSCSRKFSTVVAQLSKVKPYLERLKSPTVIVYKILDTIRRLCVSALRTMVWKGVPNELSVRIYRMAMGMIQSLLGLFLNVKNVIHRLRKEFDSGSLRGAQELQKLCNSITMQGREVMQNLRLIELKRGGTVRM